MGWRDINMNRRRPQPRLAVIPAEPGEDVTRAVLRKAAASAVAVVSHQLGVTPLAGDARLKAFAAGYLLGFALQAARKDGVDTGADAGAGIADPPMADLADALASAVPTQWAMTSLKVDSTSQPAAVGTLAWGDAGRLVGRLEARCGTRKLLGLGHHRMHSGQPGAGVDYITDCDVAADPMQTRCPTLSLRFDQNERAVILKAFEDLAP